MHLKTDVVGVVSLMTDLEYFENQKAWKIRPVVSVVSFADSLWARYIHLKTGVVKNRIWS